MRTTVILSLAIVLMMAFLVACGEAATPVPTPTEVPPTAAPAPTEAPTEAMEEDGDAVMWEISDELKAYAAEYAGGPGAIYIGDGNFEALVGPAATQGALEELSDDLGVTLGDDAGIVPLDAIMEGKWIFESDYYQLLLEKARLANPTELVSQDENITLQYACINRTTLQCKIVPAYFVRNVLERTDGQVNIEITSFPELGLAGFDTMTLLSDGTLAAAEIYGGYVGGEYPTLAVQYLWGLWPNHQTHYEVLTNVFDDIERVIKEETGAQVLLHLWIAGDDQFFFSKQRLEKPEDFKGVKTRSHSTELSDWINYMGAEAQAMAFAEVYTALERGILDAGVTGANPGLSQRWYEVTDYLNGRLYSFNATTGVVNGEVWDKIPADLQQILLEEGAKHELEALRLAAIQNITGVARNVEAGLELVEFSPEAQALSKEAARNQVIPNWLKRVGYPEKGHDTVDVFNNKIGPFVGLEIVADAAAENGFSIIEAPITKGPQAQ
jgi:TRAP-type C4-dicarboxylate transport system substrate-binding protein